MKTLTEINLLKENILVFKKIFNFGLFTQFVIKKQLGFVLNKEKIKFDLNYEIKSNLYIIIIYYKILEFLIIDTKYYKKMYDYYQNLFEQKNFLKRTIRLKMGLPVNGQRSKTNSKNSRKRFYKKFLSRIIF
jgi:ribosomal protein S13